MAPILLKDPIGGHAVSHKRAPVVLRICRGHRIRARHPDEHQTTSRESNLVPDASGRAWAGVGSGEEQRVVEVGMKQDNCWIVIPYSTDHIYVPAENYKSPFGGGGLEPEDRIVILPKPGGFDDAWRACLSQLTPYSY